MMIFRGPVLIAAAAALFAGSPANADITKCTGTINTLPMVISTSGVWCLKSNLATAQLSGYAIRIIRSNVTVELGGFRIDGSGAGLGTATDGIIAKDKSNIIIRNGTIEGFYRGIRIWDDGNDGSGHHVEKVRIVDSRHIGIYVEGENSAIRDNHVINTGPGDQETTASGIYLRECDNARVSDNKVQKVSETGAARGMRLVGCGETMVDRNSISNIDAGTFEYGIFAAGGGRIYAIENRITNNSGGTTGITATANVAFNCIRNVVAGYTTGLSNCDYAFGNLTPP